MVMASYMLYHIVRELHFKEDQEAEELVITLLPVNQLMSADSIQLGGLGKTDNVHGCD